MVDVILVVWTVGVLYAGIWIGKKYGSFKGAVRAAVDKVNGALDKTGHDE